MRGRAKTRSNDKTLLALCLNYYFCYMLPGLHWTKLDNSLRFPLCSSRGWLYSADQQMLHPSVRLFFRHWVSSFDAHQPSILPWLRWFHQSHHSAAVVDSVLLQTERLVVCRRLVMMKSSFCGWLQSELNCRVYFWYFGNSAQFWYAIVSESNKLYCV